jgi:3-isopropylmalate/(R)-2-methylmalate dehydratase small subunit
LFALVELAPGLQGQVDVVRGELRVGTRCWRFELDEGRRQRLLQGLDEVTETLSYSDSIKTYEHKRRLLEPWIFRV